MDRQQLRKQLRLQRAKLSLLEQTTASKKIAESLIQTSYFKNSQHIAIYLAVNGEINPDWIINFSKAKTFYLPKIDNDRLIFCLYEKHTPLVKSCFNIAEPAHKTQQIKPENLDLVLMPLLGFTPRGDRLGMGKGYYDKSFDFLLQLPRPNKPILIGLAYDFQKINPTLFGQQPWDVALDAVVTEAEIIYFSEN